ncbi:L domain-like protein [Neocallimastix californiae]|uniref:L domain-like protein n=1 Tax=Neocallimastix californiae TaxID=1754190 RepID=A0A1Y2EG75_9FUNG|nr:L domain-like protein [Neocallimastix californiae]|eukprot:ORY70570.1 L domain-like protein [Neocallimastix californiae]
MEINVFYVYCFIVNILIVYCNEIDNVINFINSNIISRNFTCNDDFIKCNNEHVVEITIHFTSAVKTKVDVIDYSQFPKLPELKKLIFEGNLFKGIFPKTFLDADYFPSLEYIELQKSNISEIPEIENSKSPVNEINLSLNQLSKFPTQLIHLENLKKLVLNNNKIGSLDNLEECDLEELSIRINEIDTISPDFFEDLPALKKLDISSNKIKELPISLYKLQYLTELDISENTQLNAQIAGFDSKISKCNFKNTNIDCFDVGTCIIIDDDGNQNQYKTCPKEVIDKIKNSGNKKKNVITIVIFAALAIIVSIAGSIWIHKSNKKRKNDREADINNSNINNNQNQNMNNNIVYNNTLTTTSTNQIVISQPSDRSYIFAANTSNSNIVSPMQSPIPVSQALTMNNAPLQSPITVSQASTINNEQLQSPIPVSQASTINNALLQSQNYVPFNNPSALPNGQMNVGLMNGNQADGQVFTVLPLQITSNRSNVNYYSYDLMNKMNMAAGISSTSSKDIIEVEKKILAKDKGLDTEEMVDIKYQKKILQEEDIIKKCYDNNDNLPPYSQ